MKGIFSNKVRILNYYRQKFYDVIREIYDVIRKIYVVIREIY